MPSSFNRRKYFLYINKKREWKTDKHKRESANQTKGIEILEIPDYSNIFPPLTEIIANRRVLEKEPVYKMQSFSHKTPQDSWRITPVSIFEKPLGPDSLLYAIGVKNCVFIVFL